MMVGGGGDCGDDGGGGDDGDGGDAANPVGCDFYCSPCRFVN